MFGFNKKKLVSIVISNKNSLSLLKQTIESLKVQTYKNIELIIVDDASDTELSHIYLEKIRNRPNTRVFVNEQRSGPGRSRNRAANESKGEYILIMDDDNIAKINEIETLVSIASREKADIVTCPFERFHGGSFGAHISSDSIWLPYGDDLMMSTMFNTMGDMNSLIKTSVFKALNGLTVNKKPGAEDFNLFCRAVTKGYKLVVCPEPLFWYRTHNANHSYTTGFAESLQLSADAYSELTPVQDLAPLIGMVKAWQMRLYPGGQNSFRVGSLTGGSRENLFSGMAVHSAKSENASSLFKSVRAKKKIVRDWVLVQVKENTDIKIPLKSSKNAMKYVFDFAYQGKFHVNLVEEFSKGKSFRTINFQEGRTSHMIELKKTMRPRKVYLHIGAGGGLFGLRKIYYINLQDSKSVGSKSIVLDQPQV
jgi:glycosyltransferase involved in cell wall biosynthesis